MTRYRTHRFNEYGGQEGLRDYYQANDWSSFAQRDRDDATIEMGKTFAEVLTVADMSAGGSRITPEIAIHYGASPVLGDIGRHYNYRYVGTLQETLPQFLDPFDLYVCTETLEHLLDPDEDLALIRLHCRDLLLSTPTMEEPESVSHGHLWTWRREDVEEMLRDAGFTPFKFRQISLFGIWMCR